MNTKLIVVVVAGLFLGAIAAVAILPEARHALFSPPGPHPQVSGKALVGGPFTFTDHTGKRVTDKDYRGQEMLIFFGFTSCPDICPAAMQLVSAALDKLGPKAERITPIFITVDPQRDTPERLAEFVANFNPRIVGLTGTPAETAAAAKAYRVYYKKVEDKDAPQAYTMDHTSIMYLMDANGEFITHFSPTTTPDEMAARIAKTL